jgi:hypothetical protein
MPQRWKILFTVIAAIVLVAAAMPADAGVPDITNSFYVPQSGAVATPTEGTVAARLFRMCPNNDGGTSLPNHARVKVVVRDVNGNGIPGVAAADVCVLFNGGTPAQSFSGVGADSVISNSQFNPTALCPDLRCVSADAPTDASGTTYITFSGGDPANPGQTLQVLAPSPPTPPGTLMPANRGRKWGHFDNELPVYVLGFKLSGRLTTGSANGTYSLRIKSYDWTGGLGTPLNQGESVTVADLNGVVNAIPGNTNPFRYWMDFDSSNSIVINDLNLVTNHLNHDCDSNIP